MVDKDKVRRAHVQLKAMVNNLPKWTTFPQRYVQDYETLVHELRNAGLDVSSFHITLQHLQQKVSSYNQMTKETQYADELHIDRATFLMRADGLLSYLDDRLHRQRRRPRRPRPTVATGTAT